LIRQQLIEQLVGGIMNYDAEFPRRIGRKRFSRSALTNADDFLDG
jgi:hypothetical protein